tara:strand:- start:129 stop:878 length:750 start_codon:yes stop_codon:yes gene_type:complete
MIFSIVLKLQDSLFIYFDESKVISTYQGLSRSIVLTSIIIIYSLKSRVQFLYFFVTLFVLFILGSRSEFALFLIALFIVFMFNKKATFIKILSISLSIILLILMYNPETVENLNETSRIFSLLDPQNVYASEGRGLLTDNAISTISNNVFFGDISNVDIGGSAHNILSAWEIHGFFFIILILAISLINLASRFLDFRNLTSNFYAKIAFFYSIVWFVGMITSYWYGNEMFAVALGFSAKLEQFKSYYNE